MTLCDTWKGEEIQNVSIYEILSENSHVHSLANFPTAFGYNGDMWPSDDSLALMGSLVCLPRLSLKEGPASSGGSVVALTGLTALKHTQNDSP